MRTRVAIIAVALVAVIIAVVASSGGGDSKSGAPGAAPAGKQAKAPAGATRILFAVSDEKEAMLRPLVDQFNAQRQIVDGKPVFAELEVRSSGKAERQIAEGTYKPTVWSPASSLWGRMLNYEADAQWVSDDNPSLVRTPLVIGMWEPMAQALGYPDKQVGWEDLIKLTLDPQGWGSVGKPEYGKMKLGHTNPDFSTSGLAAISAQYFAAAGKREGLTGADISRKKVRDQVKDIQSSIVHYGDTTLFFTDEMEKNGPGYASALAVEEVTLLDFNRKAKGAKLTAVYPKEGTFYSDNPYLVLTAPWVSPAQKKAAEALGAFLTEKITPELAGRYGFRPADLDAKPAGRVTKAGGVDPAQPRRVLSLPTPDVLAGMRKQWREDRKAANVMLVVDTSGSMSEENKLEEAKRGLIEGFLPQLSPRDRVGLTSFNSKVFPLLGVKEFALQRDALRTKINGLLPDGETAVFDATISGQQAIMNLRDDTRINAVVVLTDGDDTSSSADLQRVVDELGKTKNAEGRAIRVFTIAYGKAARFDELDKIAKAAGGMAFKGDTESIASVYQQISSFF